MELIAIYKLIGDNNLFKPLETVLKNRGILDFEKFLNPSESDVIHYSKLKNMDKAVRLFNNHVQKNSSMLVIVDPDVDGYSSASMLIHYIRKLDNKLNVKFLLHSGKQHGLSNEMMHQIIELKPDLLIIPDAGSNDYEHHKQLNEIGIDILILDHHEAEYESEYALVVNNQLSPEYDNKQLSGAGITYKFLKALDDLYDKNMADQYLDLVAFGNVADIMDLTSPETRYLVYRGLKNIQNPFLLELAANNTTAEEIYPVHVSFDLAPKVNALIRIGKQDEKECVFRAMLGEQADSYNPRTDKVETLSFKAQRICKNAYSRQSRLRKKWVDQIKEMIEEQGLDKNRFLLIEMPKDFDRELSGLIASGIVGTYRKPAMIFVKNKDGNYSGSLRGHDSLIEDTKEFLDSLGLFNFVQGHAQAAGFEIDSENFEKLNKEINKRLENIEINNSIPVDFILNQNDLNEDLVKEFVSYEKYWGKGCEAPTFAVKNVEIHTKNMYVADSGYTRWNINGIDYVIFKGHSEIDKIIKQNKIAVLDVVGTLKENLWKGKKSYQFIVEDLQVKELKNVGFIF